jgi:hypothetical protein
VPLNGIFRMPYAGAVVTVAFEGEPSAPNPLPGGTIYGSAADGVSIQGGGIVAFRATTAGLFRAQGLFVCDPVSCPASPADAAVLAGDVDDGANVFVALSTPSLSAAGDIAFSSRIRGAGPRSGVYIRRLIGDDIETIALDGDIVPALGAGSEFVRFNTPGMSTAGKVAFRARIRWTVAPSIRYGVFSFE